MEHIGKYKDLNIYVCLSDGIVIEKNNVKYIGRYELDKQIYIFNEGYKSFIGINYPENFSIVLNLGAYDGYWYISSLDFSEYNFIQFRNFILNNSYIKEISTVLDILEWRFNGTYR